MAAPTHRSGKSVVPYSAPDGTALKDTTTGVLAADRVLTITVQLTGTSAQLAADYATLLGTSLTASKATITHSA